MVWSRVPQNSMSIERYKFVFLCGLHRSGTSPLSRILREHPQISGFQNTGVPEDEGQHLQSVFPPANALGGPGCFGFAPEAHLTEKSPLINLENQTKLFTQWSQHWDLTKPCLLEKSPPNLIRTRFLQALFPNSYFLVISRHPIAVSMSTQKWTHSSLDSLIEHWLHCHRIFEHDRPYLNHVHLIKYEDVINNTQAELDRIYEFLGVPAHPSPALNPSGNDPYFEGWQRLLHSQSGTQTLRRVISTHEEGIQHFGYSFLQCEVKRAIARL